MNSIVQQLFELQDEKYRDFQASLMPTVDKTAIIGVRMPELRKLAGRLSAQPQAAEFMAELPHKYYEENMLHVLLIDRIKDMDTCLAEIEKILPYIDNWAVCDVGNPKAFRKNPEKLLPAVRRWLESGRTYTVRYAVGVLMSRFLDDGFSPEYPELVAKVEPGEYYIDMMRAWYFATALAKQYDAVIGYIEQQRLDIWTHNKTIQKAVESFRISDEQKSYLKTLKRR